VSKGKLRHFAMTSYAGIVTSNYAETRLRHWSLD